MSDYSPQIWQRFRAPAHAGWMELPGIVRGTALTPASEAVLLLQLRVTDGRVAAAKFQALGCPSTIAAGEWLCEWLQGRTLAEAVGLSATQIAEALAVAPARRYAAVMAEDALRAALQNCQTSE